MALDLREDLATRGRRARRRRDDAARRRDGACRARRSATDGEARRRRHDRDEDQLHAPARRPADRQRAACCTAPRRWPSAKARSATPKARPVAARDRHVQVPEAACRSARKRIRVDRFRIRLKEAAMATTNKQILLVAAPQGEAVRRELQAASSSRYADAAGRPGAGAPPLPQPRPVHARPHERREELRRAAAARRR